ncbi:MAG: DUF4231 domain-containing protein [Anaerolineae bacterium]|nr:DUF4231 domain-containing protein [Anaerolineae bacterium]
MGEEPASTANINPTAQKPDDKGKSPIQKWLLEEFPLSSSGGPNENYKLIDPEEYNRICTRLKKRLDPGELEKAHERLEADLRDLNRELMPLFRELDLRAKVSQNQYRAFQIGFMFLAALTTFVGSLQLFVVGDPGNNGIAIIGLIETLLSLATVFLVNIQGNESPYSKWLTSRQRAEQLRREYFRYLADASPYNEQFAIPKRRLLMARRATSINEGKDPDRVELDERRNDG